MKQILLCSFIIASFFCSPLLASTTKTIEFNGQNSENVDLEFKTQKTRYRSELVNATCERQVLAGYQNVCHQVTRYRQECHYEPARQECHTTPSRYECYYEPSRTQCYNEPGQIVCREENGRRVCRNQPGHQRCETIPGQRVCRTIPGQYTCNTIPGQNICRNVPYYETECRQEPRYRTEEYSCQKYVDVPYQVDILHSANLELKFENGMGVDKANIVVKLDNEGKLNLSTSASDVLIVAREESVSIDDTQDNAIKTQASYVISFLPKERVLSPVKNPADQIELSQEQLSFVIGKSFNPSQLKVTVRLQAKRSLFHREIDITKSFNGSELQLLDLSSQHKVVINLAQWGIDLPKRKFDVTITTELVLPSGKIINEGNLNLLQRRFVEKLKAE